MSVFALFLVVIAACCHAAWNFFVKRINGGPELVWLFSVLSVAMYFPLAIAVWIVQKPQIGLQEIAFIVASALLHLGYFLLLQQGYRKGDLSLVYPTARATGPFLSTGLAVFFLGEDLTPQILAGGMAVVLGVFFLTGGFKRKAAHLASSLLFGLAAGALIGSYTVWDAYTVTALLVPPLLLDYASSVCRSTLLSPYAITRWTKIQGHWRDHRGAVICIAIFNPLAYILVLIALTFAPVVYVAPARELSVLIAVVVGAVLLGEKALKERMIWALVILLGIGLLAAG